MSSKYTHVIWDWNGTLLDDADLCLTVVNTLLANRKLSPIKDIYAYRDIFGFPVINYYRRAGFDFDKEPFDIPANEFIQLYNSDDSRFRLFDGAAEVLAAFNKMGLKQIILSASELNNLRSQTGLFDIERYFDDILGISNIYAESKVNIGKSYIADNNICGAETVLIGDTVHDYEVAINLGVDCILISNGHQHKHTLLECGVSVLSDIREVIDAIKK
ncbi:MAG: HAD hydrolase-like protein [Oscillospiraceae bacterium]|nr:HAD hydrolase-like protein [Oscillospiraceae bacterium]